MHKTPYRPQHDVTQPYESGVLTIYIATDGNYGTGLLPEEVLTQKVRLPYEDRKVGIQRYYNALQNQIHIQRVVRVPSPPVPVTTQDIAITEDGTKYRIDLIQAVATYPPSLDLTLVQYKQAEEVFNGDD